MPLRRSFPTTERSLRWSRYNHVAAIPGGAVLYNAFSGAYVRLVPRERRLVGSARGVLPSVLRQDAPLFGKLLAARAVVPRTLDECREVRRYFERDFARSDRLSLVIAPTFACNLACPYCYERGAEGGNGVMSRRVQEEIVRFARRRLRGKRELFVTWFGGEPLLRLKDMEWISQRLQRLCRRLNVSYGAAVITNGTLLTPAVVGRLRRAGVVGARVTIDGPQRVHDRLRPFTGGKGSFDIVMRNVTAAADRLHLLLVVNVDRDNARAARGLLAELRRRGLDRTAVVQMNRLMQGWSKTMKEREYRRAEEAFVRASCERHVAVMPRLVPLGDYQCRGRLRDYAIVVPDGSVHRCLVALHRPEARIGVLRGGRVVRNGAAAADEGTPWSSKRCRDCRLLPACIRITCPSTFALRRRVCPFDLKRLKQVIAKGYEEARGFGEASES